MPSRYLWWTILFSRCHGAAAGTLCPWFDGHCSGALVSGPACAENCRLGIVGHFRRFFSPFPATLLEWKLSTYCSLAFCPTGPCWSPRLPARSSAMFLLLFCSAASRRMPAGFWLASMWAVQERWWLLWQASLPFGNILTMFLMVENSSFFFFSGISFAFLTILLAAMSFLNG